MLQADLQESRGARLPSLGRRAIFGAVLVAASLLLGVVSSEFRGSLGFALAGAMAVAVAGVIVPERWLSYLVLVSVIFGFVPIPDIGGYQVELEYPVVLVGFLRVLLNGHLAEGLRMRGWRAILWTSAALIVAMAVSLVHALIAPDPDLTRTQILIAYAKWLAPFLFLLVLVAGTRDGRPPLAKPLLICIWLTVFADSAVTLVISAGDLTSLLTQAGDRISFRNTLGPNRTGVLADIAIIAALGLATIRWHTPLALASLPVLAAVAYLSGSREALVTLAVVGLIYVFRLRPRRLQMTMVGWLLVAGLVGALALSADPGLVPQSLFRAVNYAYQLPTGRILGIVIPSSLALRLYLNLSGILVFFHNPVLGLGFQHSLNIALLSEYGVLGVVSPSHDSFISVAAQNGILALLAAAGFTALLLVLAFRSNEAGRPRESSLSILALQCAILIIIVDSLATDLIFYDSRAMFVLIAVVVALIDERRQHRPTVPVAEPSGSTAADTRLPAAGASLSGRSGVL